MEDSPPPPPQGQQVLPLFQTWRCTYDLFEGLPDGDFKPGRSQRSALLTAFLTCWVAFETQRSVRRGSIQSDIIAVLKPHWAAPQTLKATVLT